MTTHPGALFPPPAQGVTVRMYRQGLGDCFLLAFRADDGTGRYMLIDCGVLRSTSDEESKMQAVMENIRDATGGHLHVLVVTHQHYDHLCGFKHAQEIFKEIQVDEVWFAWTEDPNNAYANQLRHKRQQTLQAIGTATQRLREAGETDSALRLDHLIQFFGIDDSLSAAGGARPSQTEVALEIVREHCDNHRYCRPGQGLLHMPGVGNVRIYVLGPPENELIKKSDPTQKGREVYEYSPAFSTAFESAFLASAIRGLEKEGDGKDQAWRDLSFPFDKRHQLSVQSIESNQSSETSFFYEHYFAEDDSWRRIGQDWLGAVDQLALQLDSDTNNTSLVLAIELVESGKVLLFPADAQVGNWLSWENLTWLMPKDDREATVTVQDLLSRTVLYKVGHHGSHNATLRAKGLELMVSPDLVALIPVDEEMARKQGKKGWDMPFPPLAQRLQERTKGRIIRSDQGVPATKSPLLNEHEWQQFTGNVRQDSLYIDVTIS